MEMRGRHGGEVPAGRCAGVEAARWEAHAAARYDGGGGGSEERREE